MDMRLMVIMGVVAILMVAFGNNPVEEAEKRLAEERAKGDPLVNAIEEHNSKNGGLMMGGPGMSMDSILSPNGVASSYPGYSGYQPPGNAGYGDGNIVSPYGNGTAASQNSGGGTASNPNSYYPPPPLYDPNQPNYNSGVLGPRSDTNSLFVLPDGRPLIHRGTRVFTYDAEGNQIPVPDGVYAILGGRFNIYIRDGQKVTMTN